VARNIILFSNGNGRARIGHVMPPKGISAQNTAKDLAFTFWIEQACFAVAKRYGSVGGIVFVFPKETAKRTSSDLKL